MKHPSAPKPGKPLLVLVLFVAAVFILSLTLALRSHRSMPAAPAPVVPAAQAASPSGHVALAAFSQEEAPVHILLIGQDRRENESRARSDAILLCSFLPDSNRLVLTSFLRDLYVEIPGYQSDRINAAYAYGGAELLQKSLESNFDITIDACLEVDFFQFAQAIDSLGGVTVTLRQDEADAINSSVSGELSQGDQLLTGEQALAYTRIRNLDSDGDFSRTRRQRAVLTALLERFRNSSLRNLLSAATDVLPMLSSNSEQKHLLSLAIRVFPMLSDARITSQRIPTEGNFTYSTIRGMEVLEADMAAARQLLKDSFAQ